MTELKIIGHVGKENAKDVPENQAIYMFGGTETDPDYLNLCDVEEAHKEISKRDAEIARLQKALRGIIDTAHNLPEFMRIEAMQKEAEKALKGPGA